MQSKIILSTLVALSAANVLPRQTDAGDASACASDAQVLGKTIPTPPPAIAKDLQKAGEDACAFTPAASLSAQYSSYLSKFESWAKDNESLINKLSSECPKQATAGLPKFSCDGKNAPTATGGSSEPTATGGDSTDTAAQATGTGVDSSSSAGASGATGSAKPSATGKGGDGKSAGNSVQAGVGAVLGAALLVVVAL